MVRHPATGKYRRTRLFVMTLAHSRKAVRLLTWQSSTKTWAQLPDPKRPQMGDLVEVFGELAAGD